MEKVIGTMLLVAAELYDPTFSSWAKSEEY